LHVINYDLLSARLPELQAVGFKSVIFDECHHLKNGKSKRTAAAKVIVRRVPVRLGLSGTPILNCPQELLTQLHVLGRMKDVGGFWHFAKHYCAAKQSKHGWDFSGSANLVELHERLRGLCFLRRTKEQVLPELPPKISTRVPLGMTPEGWAKYHAAAKDLLGYLGEKAANAPGFQKQLAGMNPEDAEWAKAQRIAEVIEKMDGMELLRRLGELLQVAAAGKLALAKEWIREMCASRKLVLFAHHRAILSGPGGLLDEFRGELGAVLIDGDTPSAKRQGMVRDFKTGKGRLFLVNLIAGGTGLDGLQHAASDVAFLERPWTPAGLEQAASRLHRIGQGGTVHDSHLIGPGTVDDELLALLAVKAEVCSGVNDGLEAR
jgi:SNF2 family DNA or RNA helicase